jgi:hypothetical protein
MFRRAKSWVAALDLASAPDPQRRVFGTERRLLVLGMA